MQEIKYIITDPRGIHARPAGQLVKLLKTFGSSVQMGSADKLIDGKHLLSVMKLSLQQGDTLVLQFTGDDEAAASEAALKFLQENL